MAKCGRGGTETVYEKDYVKRAGAKSFPALFARMPVERQNDGEKNVLVKFFS
jgi:hypothetical protein